MNRMMFVASFPRLKQFRMLAIFVRLAILAAVCCGTSSLHEAERLTRENRETNKIHSRQVLIENLNVEIYTEGPPSQWSSSPLPLW